MLEVLLHCAGKDTDAEAWSAALLEEAYVMADMPGLATGDAVPINSTYLSNTFICQPQQRNMYGRIFGGFLMRRAYEIAFATAHMFAGCRPQFIQVGEVRFLADSLSELRIS